MMHLLEKSEIRDRNLDVDLSHLPHLQSQILRKLAEQSDCNSEVSGKSNKQKYSKNIEVMIKFESRLHRDKFIAYLRSIKAIRVFILDKFFENFNKILNMDISSYENGHLITDLDEDSISEMDEMIDQTK